MGVVVGPPRQTTSGSQRGEDARHRPLPRLGPNGEGWVAIQTLLALVVLAAAPLTPWAATATPVGLEAGRIVATIITSGAILVLAGVALFIWGAVTLGVSFSIWLRPTASAHLVTSGPYRFLRHPICTAQALIGLGVAAFFVSVPAFVLALAYAAYLDFGKLRAEEDLLEARYPRYAEYRRSVPRRMVPLPRR